MHDENVIRSETGAFCVVDCDIRINTPELRLGGTRKLTNEMVFTENIAPMAPSAEGQR